VAQAEFDVTAQHHIEARNALKGNIDTLRSEKEEVAAMAKGEPRHTAELHLAKTEAVTKAKLEWSKLKEQLSFLQKERDSSCKIFLNGTKFLVR